MAPVSTRAHFYIIFHTCHCTSFLFADIKKTLQYGVRWRGAVDEEQILMMKPGVGEPFGVVDLLVQPDDAGDVVKSEVWEVGLGRVERITVLNLRLRMRSTKC